MASSSDWIALSQASSQSNDETGSSWIDALMEPRDFIEGLPVMRGASARAPLVPDRAESLSDGDEPIDPLQDAFARGQAAGHAAARAELEREQSNAQARQRALRLTFQEFDQAAMDCFANDLAETVIALCDKAFSEHVPDSDVLRQRCEEAARRLGTMAQDCALHLNPDDLDLMDPETLDQWRVVPDDALARGGLRFEGPDGAISDGPSEWRRAIAAAVRG